MYLALPGAECASQEYCGVDSALGDNVSSAANQQGRTQIKRFNNESIAK